MTQLVYLSPVPWFSFSQRPHKFVEWFRAMGGDKVIWVDPYPTRLPKLSDVRRLKQKNDHGTQQGLPPAWMQLIRPKALPVEPLPVAGWANRLLWQQNLAAIGSFAGKAPTLLVIGKPSLLALSLLSTRWFKGSVYDSMDHFAAFYSGISRYVMSQRERAVGSRVEALMASSTCLQEYWRSIRADVALVRNACDPAVLPAPREPSRSRDQRPVLGYVGTIGGWFDWDAVRDLARARPDALVRLVGPMAVAVPHDLPANVEMLPPCAHDAAMRAVAEFDVGLIPFKRNQLTESVDPIKYYEYRAMGLPVISTRFGEMRYRAGEAGVFLADTADEQRAAAQLALTFQDGAHAPMHFRENEGWTHRFSDSPVAAMMRSGGGS
ncbi:glycosyltransferase [Cupriavidus agavae]|uniref:Glycosyl transferase family 1 n=1 Tax=Cupriavidus agavae TaxID=1001822 RepID=A0A4Q7S4T6_9BURK|nr:glycosyltransferase [Cupriavidus agavae]RZT41343.1 glycosyl transferase family 1 [Cupriavidus agavae]